VRGIIGKGTSKARRVLEEGQPAPSPPARGSGERCKLLQLVLVLYRNRQTTFAYLDDGGCAPLRVVDGAASEMR